MAHASHANDYSPEEALREIQSERSRRSWIAVILFVLAAVATGAGFYMSYASPAYDDQSLPERP